MRESGIYRSQISRGIGQSPFSPRPFEAISAVVVEKRVLGVIFD